MSWIFSAQCQFFQNFILLSSMLLVIFTFPASECQHDSSGVEISKTFVSSVTKYPFQTPSYGKWVRWNTELEWFFHRDVSDIHGKTARRNRTWHLTQPTVEISWHRVQYFLHAWNMKPFSLPGLCSSMTPYTIHSIWVWFGMQKNTHLFSICTKSPHVPDAVLSGMAVNPVIRSGHMPFWQWVIQGEAKNKQLQQVLYRHLGLGAALQIDSTG